ncbi:MAG: Eco57I restriction-modification methylase domain-containing protein, partial [Spirochaetia bacterium]|nr:Eco57I restriction-modification methylase domain-containing protein [Spirochaetia bacterium]
GNSLIGSDFYADKDLTLFGMEEQRKVNVFDWDKQFAAVFKNGGFDCVIGNPPYVLCQPGTTDEYLLNYYKNYHVASYKIDLFHLFFEKSIKLLNDSGLMGFITPNTYLTNKYIKVLREFILENTKVERIVNHDKVFDSVSVDVATIILNKNKSKDDSVIIQKTEKGVFIDVCTKKQKDWENDSEYVFNINESFSLTLKNTFNLGDSYSSYFGIQAFDRNSSISEEKINDDYLPIIDGEDIHPFDYSVPKKFFNYKKGNIKSGGDWSVYSLERIVVRQIGAVPVVGLCEKDILASNTLYSIWSKNDEYSLLYLLCILNSKTLKYIWASKYSDNKGLFPKIKGFQLKELPIPTATADQQQKLSSLATQMLDAHRQLGLAKSEADKAMLAQRIDILDAQINALVYSLYGLTKEEIAVVEGR